MNENLKISLIRALNNRIDIEVVDIWCNTITILVKSASFFSFIPNLKWNVAGLHSFNKEIEKGSQIFIILNLDQTITPQFLVITNPDQEPIALNANNVEVNEDDFFKSVGYFPDILALNKSERKVNFEILNANRLIKISSLL